MVIVSAVVVSVVAAVVVVLAAAWVVDVGSAAVGFDGVTDPHPTNEAASRIATKMAMIRTPLLRNADTIRSGLFNSTSRVYSGLRTWCAAALLPFTDNTPSLRTVQLVCQQD